MQLVVCGETNENSFVKSFITYSGNTILHLSHDFSIYQFLNIFMGYIQNKEVT